MRRAWWGKVTYTWLEVRIFITACILALLINTIYIISGLKLAHPEWSSVWT